MPMPNPDREWDEIMSYQNGTEDDFKDSPSQIMEMPKTPKELESFIKDYLKENMQVSVRCDHDGDGYMNLNVYVTIGGESIPSDGDGFRM